MFDRRVDSNRGVFGFCIYRFIVHKKNDSVSSITIISTYLDI